MKPLKRCEMLLPDEGYYFGLGVFETMYVKDEEVKFQELHLKRITESAVALGMIEAGTQAYYREIIQVEIQEFLKEKRNEQIEKEEAQTVENGKLSIAGNITNQVLKAAWSGESLFLSIRPNNYTKEQYEKGFSLKISPILRNETSLFTYHKTLNYGDNILEKRRAHREEFDEPIFLNSRGEITEGATTNIFIVTEEGIFTPPVSSGLLNGTMRQAILTLNTESASNTNLNCTSHVSSNFSDHMSSNLPNHVSSYLSDYVSSNPSMEEMLNYTRNLTIREKVLYPDDLKQAKEIFVTNALLGVMPVSKFEEQEYFDHRIATYLQAQVREDNAVK